MSYTVIIDEHEREQRFENRLNEIYRHCRIGKVMRKMVLHGGQIVSRPSMWPEPMRSPVFYSGGYVHTTRSDKVPPVFAARSA